MFQKYPRLMALAVGFIALVVICAIFAALFISDKPKKHGTVIENRQIAFVQTLTPVTRIVTDTFKFEVNADSTVAKKVMYRDTFYVLRQPGYDSIAKKDTIYTYFIPKELVLIDKPKQ